MVRPRGTGPAASRSGVRCRLPGRTCGSAVTGNGPPRPLRDSVGARTGRAPVAVRSPRRPPRRQGTRPDGGPRGPRRTAPPRRADRAHRIPVPGVPPGPGGRRARFGHAGRLAPPLRGGRAHLGRRGVPARRVRPRHGPPLEDGDAPCRTGSRPRRRPPGWTGGSPDTRPGSGWRSTWCAPDSRPPPCRTPEGEPAITCPPTTPGARQPPRVPSPATTGVRGGWPFGFCSRFYAGPRPRAVGWGCSCLLTMLTT